MLAKPLINLLLLDRNTYENEASMTTVLLLASIMSVIGLFVGNLAGRVALILPLKGEETLNLTDATDEIPRSYISFLPLYGMKSTGFNGWKTVTAGEILCAVSFPLAVISTLWAGFGTMPMTWCALWVAVSWVFAVIAIVDFKHYIIPNGMNIALLILGIVAAGLGNWKLSLGAAVAGLTFFLIMRFYGDVVAKKPGFGMGDIKMVFPLGLLLGPHLAQMIIYSSFTALVFGLYNIWYTGKAKMDMQEGKIKEMPHPHGIPFGTFMAIGTWVVLIRFGGIMPQDIVQFITSYRMF